MNGSSLNRCVDTVWSIDEQLQTLSAGALRSISIIADVAIAPLYRR